MIAGKTPFAGDSVSETFANLINVQPLPLAQFASNVPNELQRIVSKGASQKSDERYPNNAGITHRFEGFE
jgi:hypothetical protein